MAICKTHEDIEKSINKIRELIEEALDIDSIDGIKDVLDKIDQEAYDTIEIIDEAKEMGGKMEKRLLVYRNAIEDLGFTRCR